MVSRMLSYTLFNFLVLGFCMSAACQSSTTTKNSEATEAYNKADYDTALNIWTNLYKSGNTDPNLLLNIGNAYAMLDSTAYAILFYEKALRFKPSNKEIQTVIKNERSRMVDSVAPLEQFFLVRWIKGFLVIFRPAVWAAIGLLLLLLGIVKWYFKLHEIGKKNIRPQINTWIIVGVGIILLMIAISAYRQIYRTDEAIIFSPCESRQGPSEQSPLVRTLYPGEKVIIVDTINEWYKVNLLNLDEAWIRKDCAVVIDLHAWQSNLINTKDQ